MLLDNEGATGLTWWSLRLQGHLAAGCWLDVTNFGMFLFGKKQKKKADSSLAVCWVHDVLVATMKLCG